MRWSVWIHLRALNSVLGIEVIVVDNASTDGTPQTILERYPEVKLIQNEANLGLPRRTILELPRRLATMFAWSIPTSWCLPDVWKKWLRSWKIIPTSDCLGRRCSVLPADWVSQ